MWEWGHRNKNNPIFEELPVKLSRRLDIVKHNTLVTSLNIFKSVSSQCTIAVVNKLKNRLSPHGEYVVIQNTSGDELFLISRGRVQVTELDDSFEEVPLAQIGEGSFFGEMALLSDDGKRMANVLTLFFCEFEMLSRKAFESLTLEYPELKQAIEKICDARRAEIRQLRLIHESSRRLSSMQVLTSNSGAKYETASNSEARELNRSGTVDSLQHRGEEVLQRASATAPRRHPSKLSGLGVSKQLSGLGVKRSNTLTLRSSRRVEAAENVNVAAATAAAIDEHVGAEAGLFDQPTLADSEHS